MTKKRERKNDKPENQKPKESTPETEEQKQKVQFDNMFRLAFDKLEKDKEDSPIFLYLIRNKIPQCCLDDENRFCSSVCTGFFYDDNEMIVLINCRMRPFVIDLLTKQQREEFKKAKEKAEKKFKEIKLPKKPSVKKQR